MRWAEQAPLVEGQSDEVLNPIVSRMYTLLGADGRTYESALPGMFGGHRRTRIYGRLDCQAALRAIARGGYVRHRVFFADEATAVAAGYRPCAVCLSDRYAEWKAARSWTDRGLPGQ